ncbi:MAG: chromosomal replication initiator protein DnaA [Clostridia bacterium]|jgi:chromosomal replication initiator protein|nr:chromosomal replication initiator protein DnaA [Clostridia bacterium]
MNNDIQVVWNEVLSLLKSETTSISFNTWFQNLKPLAIKDTLFVIETDNSFSLEILNKRHSSLITNCINEVTGGNYEIKIVLPNQFDINQSTKEQKIAEKIESIKKDPLNFVSNLNPRYIFDTFVVGNGNRMAHAASLAVAESPGKAYNPLFIYGGAGLGKTHLMHSIGHFILEQKPDAKILYVTSEKFTNELINAIKDDRNEEFRAKYRTIDVLLVDDIQFIGGKERTQEEFFHTFNALYENNKQIIISSDRPPKEIETLEERLRSRFEWGLIADVSAPDFETRIAILRKKAETDNIEIADDILTYVAKSVFSNIRELEGALNRIVAFSSLTNGEINMEIANEAIKDLMSEDKPRIITPEYIQEVVANYYNLKDTDLSSKRRTRNIAFPRQIAMYLSRELTDLSLPKIGEKFGGRDHTTIIHGYEKIKTDLEDNSELKKVIQELKQKLS